MHIILMNINKFVWIGNYQVFEDTFEGVNKGQAVKVDYYNIGKL